MPLPIVVFRRLGIPVYAVWDADRDEGRQRGESERIAEALGRSGKGLRGRICGRFACPEVGLEGTIRSGLEKAPGPAGPSGPHCERILGERRALHGIRKKDSMALDAHLIMEEARDKGMRLETISMIVREIAALAERAEGRRRRKGRRRPPVANSCFSMGRRVLCTVLVRRCRAWHGGRPPRFILCRHPRARMPGIPQGGRRRNVAGARPIAKGEVKRSR